MQRKSASKTKNPQEKREVLVIDGIAIKRVEAESGLVFRLTGGGSTPR